MLLKIFESKTPANCLPELGQYGFDCSCPFNIPAQSFDESYSFEMPNREGNTALICSRLEPLLCKRRFRLKKKYQ